MTTTGTAFGLVLRHMGCDDVARIARAAEAAGFTDIFFPETGHTMHESVTGRDPFVLAGAALTATASLRAGPGVAATVLRPSYAMAITAGTLHEASGGRFILGCGVSHAAPMLQHGDSYPSSPIAHIRGYLDGLRAMADVQLGFGQGFPIYLSALGPKMLKIASSRSDGVMLNWLGVEAARAATARVHSLRRTDAPVRSVLYLRIGRSADLHAEAQHYHSLRNYEHHFARQDLFTLPSIVDRTCLPEDPSQAVQMIATYRDAGVDVPAVYPVGMSADEVCELVAEFGKHRGRDR